MKKILIAFGIAALTSASALADTINITYVQDNAVPMQSQAIVSKGSYAFQGTDKIIFKILGKTCTFVGSAKAIGPVGCNYSMTANVSTMKLSDPSAENNPGCTPPSKMLASCK